ncbi:hypothetical protein [Oceanibacterium hippocampi]|uniref:hypothetical protein n=1 Tax=Oceanibacterium hippocampi TaxID=745714 RepID=UPI00111C3947|nr:hypothetical protein [Oceanibacterium hippocampi]
MRAQDQIDTRAIELAQQALSRIDGHEKICSQNQAALIARLAEIKSSIAGLYNRFWLAAVSLIGLLVCVIGWLLAVYVLPARAEAALPPPSPPPHAEPWS